MQFRYRLFIVLKANIWAAQVVCLGSSFKLGNFGQGFILGSDLIELFLGHLLKVEQRIVGTLRSPDKLVKLDLYGLGFDVLSVLNQEDHQKGNDRCRRIDRQLPGVAVIEKRSCRDPSNDRSAGDCKRC